MKFGKEEIKQCFTNLSDMIDASELDYDIRKRMFANLAPITSHIDSLDRRIKELEYDRDFWRGWQEKVLKIVPSPLSPEELALVKEEDDG